MASDPVLIYGVSFTTINRIIGQVFIALGAFLFLAAGYFIHRNGMDEFLLPHAVAEGEVIENSSHMVYPGTGSRFLPFTSYQAVIRFTDRQGQTRIFRDHFGFSQASFAPGQKVQILYDPQDPQRAMVDRGVKNFIVPGVCAFFAGFLLLSGFQRVKGSV